MKSLKVIYLSNIDEHLLNKRSFGSLHELIPFDENLYRLKRISIENVNDVELTCFVLSSESNVIEQLYFSKIDILEQPYVGLYRKRTKDKSNIKELKKNVVRNDKNE